MTIQKKIKKFVQGSVSFSLILYPEGIFAVSTLGDIASNIVTSFVSIVHLITAVAYIAGIAFGMSAILKFKQHKDNPTQITVGQPLSLLLISAALVWMPMLIQSTGVSLFGSSGTGSNTGTVSGRDIF